METPTNIILFPNGAVSVTGPQMEVCEDVQRKGWLQLYLEYLESKGCDPTKIFIEARLNGGEWKQIVPFKTEDGIWNYSFEDKIKRS